MAIKAKVPSPIHDWASQDESVFDFPGEAALRSLTRLVMPDPVTDMINPMPTGPAAPLISIFKNAAARKLATDEFLESARRMGLPNLEIAANTFASKYPRVAAHMRMSPEVAPGAAVKADVNIPQYGIRKPVPVRLGNSGIDEVDDSVAAATKSIFHEGNHVAQALGDRRMGLLYNNATRAVGYGPNPYEVTSRRAGDKAIGLDVDPYVPVRKQLASITEKPKSIVESLYELVGKVHPKTRAKHRIQELITKPEKAKPLGELWGDPK